MYELDKPCIVYRADCPLYEKEGDGMTNEKAIEELKDIKSAYSNKQQFHEACLMRSEHEALDVAIKALEQEPCDDAISRQAVLEAFKPRGIAEDVWQECNEYKVLMSLPSVNLQPKTGHCTACKHYMSGENDGSCDSYVCNGYSDWESEE